MNKFDNNTIKSWVVDALTEFYHDDSDMIESLGEVPISIRIGMHIFKKFYCLQEYDYRVDCEYDKAAMDPKPAPQGYTGGKHMRPDIIIHKRAKKGEPRDVGNLLFCEIKKKVPNRNDKEKLEYAISEAYKYQLAVSIHHIEPDSIKITWYEKGNAPCEVKYTYDVKRLVEVMIHEIHV